MKTGKRKTKKKNRAVRSCSFFSFSCLFFLAFLSFTLIVLDVFERSSEQNANLLSRLTYWWLNPLLVKGYRNQLQYEDMPRLMDVCKKERNRNESKEQKKERRMYAKRVTMKNKRKKQKNNVLVVKSLL